MREARVSKQNADFSRALEQVRSAELLMHGGREAEDQALQICADLIDKHGEHFAAFFISGLIYKARRQFGMAVGMLSRAIVANPTHWQAMASLAFCCGELRSHELAATYYKSAIELNSDDPMLRVNHAESLRRSGALDDALAGFETALSLQANLENAIIGRARCLTELGREAEAAHDLIQIVRDGKLQQIALIELSVLPSVLSAETITKWSPDDAVFPIVDQSRPDVEALEFVKGLRLHYLCRHEEAWRVFSGVNRLIDARLSAEYERLRTTEIQIMELAKSGDGSRLAQIGEPSFINLMILGPSRSGKTTLEMLLRGVAGVRLGHENFSVEKAVRSTMQNKGMLVSTLLEVIPSELHSQFIKNFLSITQRMAAGIKVLTNTNPSRVLDVYRLLELIDNLKVIFVRRDRFDNIIRIFMKRYLNANSYAYDLRKIADHVDWYNEMADVIVAKFPDRVLQMQYEEIIKAPEKAVFDACAFLGLPCESVGVAALTGDCGISVPYRAFMEAELR